MGTAVHVRGQRFGLVLNEFSGESNRRVSGGGTACTTARQECVPMYHRGRQDALTEHRYTVLFEPAEEGGYVVRCPALPGLITEGDTIEDARAMAEDAIRAYLESLRKDNLPLPTDRKPVREEIRVVLSDSA